MAGFDIFESKKNSPLDPYQGYVPPQPPTDVNLGTIEGYGDKVVVSPTGGEQTDQWGEPVSSDYVSDVRKKVSGQEPIPQKPLDAAVELNNQWMQSKEYNFIKSKYQDPEDVRIEAEKRAHAGLTKDYQPTDWALVPPEKKAIFRQQAMAEADKAVSIAVSENKDRETRAFELFKLNLAQKKENTPSEYRTFYNAQKQAGKTDAQIDDAWKQRELERAERSRQQPQQSQFVDPKTGNPLIFDKATNSYRVAKVEGEGGVEPRPVNPSATERERIAALNVLKGQLERVEKDYKPEYVGLVSGQVGRITQFTDKKEAAFRQVILDIKDSLLRARSGAQINEQEYARLAKLVPDFTDSEPQFAGKMESFKTSLGSMITERQESMRRGGVKTRDGGPTTGSKPQLTPAQAIEELKRRGKL